MSGLCYVARARRLVGTPFRPQGRAPGRALDCVGLVLSTYEIALVAAPRNYRLKGKHFLLAQSCLLEHFARVAAPLRASGDLLLTQVSAEQIHFAIHGDRTFIHADAGIGRIVEVPGDVPWAILGTYRRQQGH